jgi:putative phosphoesterase
VTIAVLADIHGNAAALRAVLADLPSVDEIVCCGDLVGYYPEPAEVVDRMRRLAVRCIRGNHELMTCGKQVVPPERVTFYRIDQTRAALSREQLEWLCALPAEHEMLRQGLTIRLRHASPWDEQTYLYPDSPAVDRIELSEGTWLIVGHTHYPMQLRRGEGWLVNPGSVGQPRDWDPRAAYALLDPQTGEWRQRRVAYDHAAYQRRLQALGWHPHAIALLGRIRAEGATP